MTRTITIDDAIDTAAQSVAARAGVTVEALYAQTVEHQRLVWADANAAADVGRKLKLADAIDAAKDDDTKVKIVAAAEKAVADAKEEL